VPTDEIIVLANSRKLGGRCVAGISTRSGCWVRPVSRLPHGQLEPAHCRVEGRQAQLLDVVEIEEAYQRLRPHLTRGPRLFGNGGAAVPDETAQQGMGASPALVQSTRPLEFLQVPPHPGKVRRRQQVRFRLGPQTYELVLTDFTVGPSMAPLDCGEYSAVDLGLAAGAHSLVTVSLGEPHEGWRPKLAAAVLLLP
jgi:hypothetical protein